MNERDRPRSRTWSRSFLAKVAIAILIASAGLAALVGALRPSNGRARPQVPERLSLMGERPTPPDPRTWLDPWLASEQTDFGAVLDAIPWLVFGEPAAGGAQGVLAALERSLQDGRRREIAMLLVRSYVGEEPLPRLAALAHSDEPPPYANLALGHALGPSAASAAAYEREASLHDSDRARRHALRTHAQRQADGDLARLLGDPAYAAVADASIPYIIAHQRLDWVGLMLWTGPAQYSRVSATFVALGIASGIIWLVFLLYAGDVRSLKSSRLALCAIAVLLGALSTVPTLVLDVWMEEVLGIRPAETLEAGLAYFVVSVGLREELCKLLLFLPLAPFVIRRGDPLEMLIVAGCVGLGFAAEENVSYFAQSGGAAAAGRFLTANFGHVIDTGLIGFAFCRMWTEKRVTDFFLVFVLVVIGHGVYDALIVVPALSGYSPLSVTIYVAVAYIFFGELRTHSRVARRPVPLTAVFVFGLATLVGLTLLGASWELGFTDALSIMVPGTLGAALFVFIFFRQIDEPLLP